MTTVRFALPAIAFLALPGATGCIQIDQLVYEHENPEEHVYEGDVDQGTDVESVIVDEVNTDVTADVDTQVDSETNVQADVDASVAGDGDDEPSQSSVTADGFALAYEWDGPFSETVTLTVTPGEDAPAWATVELLVVAPRFGPATPWDDPAGFEWGEPQATEPDEYVLATFVAPDALAPFVWDMHSAWCDGDTCWPRAIEKACEADLVARVWLDNGEEREARVRHDSPRAACL